ncbi:hypothetical protein [Pyxidicoccus xibeiensis]|uniref:hypothetical protein n=1 Tax=Pyxidicoccus xibeiensis TaxID=2906759 RepID=UPI0020A78A70|nr:hypothetical protein [Pyxidicoccus xibeiensis]MCP3141865.1 hypothetical protein [Pyxidicoccus xibeiensis]
MHKRFVLPALCLAFASPARAQGITHEYTELSTCTRPPSEDADEAPEGSDAPIYCLGPGGTYTLSESYSAYDIQRDVSLTDDAARFSVDLRPKAECPVARYGPKLEWRLKDGKPFAVIQRVTCYALDEALYAPGKRLGEYLVVKGLKGYESIDGEVPVKTKGANDKARAIADEGLQKR